jgi:hypothetical protein
MAHCKIDSRKRFAAAVPAEHRAHDQVGGLISSDGQYRSAALVPTNSLQSVRTNHAAII